MADGCVVSVSEDEFQKVVLDNPGTVLVDFFTTWCPPCRQVAPILEALCVEQRSSLTIVKVNAAENPNITSAHKIAAVPTFVLYHAGRRISQVSGFQSKPQFEKWIASSVDATRH